MAVRDSQAGLAVAVGLAACGVLESCSTSPASARRASSTGHDGGGCAKDTDCCDPLKCSSGKCGMPGQCGDTGAGCAVNTDCCNGNLCTARSLSTCGVIHGAGCMALNQGGGGGPVRA